MSEPRLPLLTLAALTGLVCLSITGCAPSGVASPTSERVIFTPALVPILTTTPTPTGTLIPSITPTPSPEPTPTQVAEGLTITIIYDNNPYDERLETAWGFSCLVEGLEKTILFDTGGDSAMLLRKTSRSSGEADWGIARCSSSPVATRQGMWTPWARRASNESGNSSPVAGGTSGSAQGRTSLLEPWRCRAIPLAWE